MAAVDGATRMVDGDVFGGPRDWSGRRREVVDVRAGVATDGRSGAGSYGRLNKDRSLGILSSRRRNRSTIDLQILQRTFWGFPITNNGWMKYEVDR